MRSIGMLMSPALAFTGYGPRHSAPKSYRTINRLNRSRHHPPARSYKHARELSPFPDRPVR